VLCRIKADAAKPPSSFVAKKIGDEAMCCLVKGNGDDHRNDPDRRQINYVVGHFAVSTFIGCFYGNLASSGQPDPLRCIVLGRRQGNEAALKIGR